MKISLLAPFRCLLNLDSDLLVQRAGHAHTLFDRAAAQFSEPGVSVRNGLPEKRHDFQKYASLTEDAATYSSRPAATFVVAPSGFAAHETALVGFAARHGFQNTSFARIASLRFHVFDNTVAVADCELEIDRAVLGEIDDISQVDYLTTDFSRYLSGDVAPGLIAAFIRVVQELQVKREYWPYRTPLLKSSKDFIAFDDVKFGRFPEWPETERPLIWSQRTVVLEREEADLVPRILRLAHATESEIESTVGKPEWHLLRGGTCIFYNSDTYDSYREIAPTLQYFAALFDALNESLRRIYARLSTELRGRSFDLEIKRSSHISAFLDFFISEFEDYFLVAVQGHRRTYGLELANVYNLREIVRNLKNRQTAVNNRLKQLVDARNLRLQRGVEAALFGIASISVVQLVYDIGVDTREPEEVLTEPIPGPVYLIDQLALDSTLTALLLFVIAFALIYYYRRL